MCLNKFLRRILAWLEVRTVLKSIESLSEGYYSFKHAELDDLIGYLCVVNIEEETDGLVYRKTIVGFYKKKRVTLVLWSCGISIVRCWIMWDTSNNVP